jgi:hypothetical protein
MAAETMENELKTLRQIARDLNMVPEGNRNTPSIQVLYMDGVEDMPYAYRSIKSLADETVDKIVGNDGYPEDSAPQEWLPVADALERAGRRIRAAVQQVMAAQSTESTHLDTSRVTTAHNRTFTE